MNPLTLYERLLGPAYGSLPLAVQRFHRLRGHHRLVGEVHVEAPDGWAARLLAGCLGAPRSDQRGVLSFHLRAEPQHEAWVRHFPLRTMRSRLSLQGGRLVESLGAAQLTFELEAGAEGLRMRLVGLRFLGIPCPRACLPRVLAHETGVDRLQFHVEAVVPLLGRVACYRGHLALPQGDTA